NQVTRIVLLVLATAVNTIIVRQSQRYFAASIYDPLTGLTNRRYAFQRLVEIVGAAQRTRRPVTVAIIDLDHFKHINDRFGHAAGDRVLVQFADMLRSSFRASDVLSRYGGEEFLLILPEGDVSGAVSRLENFRIRFAAQRFGGAASGLTLSIGVALFPEDGKTPEVLIGRADERLYQAKNAGRDRVVTPHGGTPVVVRMDGR
ncbi:MAG TPA: GGDEF domain-containing protein, partial [Thermoanaerobaculia bacterium]|nr:GGDEF domain-containing protein [Thermoanaerobaculia bacterium]